MNSDSSISKSRSDGTSLHVAESFYSIQGEGANTGKAAWFVRLAGCNVRCPWCDSPATWDARRHPLRTIDSIVSEIACSPAVNVVITGGEPLLHPLEPLCAELRERGYRIYLETSGTSPLRGDFDWICVSPKKHCPPLREVLAKADELKVVIGESTDTEWAESVRKSVGAGCVLMMQPEWGRRQSASRLIVEYVKAHPEWRISLQTHKYLDIP